VFDDDAAMTVHIEDTGHVRVVIIDRVERANAIDPEMSLALGATFSEAATADDVRVLVLTGAGDRAFCSGMDLRAFREGRASMPTDAVAMDVFTEKPYPKPIIAAVNGAAVGGGFGMALACDLLVAAEHATFGLPEVQRGLVGVGATSRAALRLPPAVVLELALTGEPIDADRAFQLGLVNRVVPAHELRATALSYAQRIAANGPLAVQAAKGIVADTLHLHDGIDLPALRRRAEPVMRSEDAKEGAAAFVERRSPRCTGR
jgi:enoyl-CoA hydratase/carnithine racemase